MTIDEKHPLTAMPSIPASIVMPLQITISQMEDRTLVVLAGELDDLTAPFLRDKLANLAGDVVLDVGLLRFLDSTGMALFVTMHKKLQSQDHRLVIFSPTPSARRLFEITGLTEFLHIQPARSNRKATRKLAAE
jgi:stage II sporulation protein AA (anti-sigma F factor antagonist)